MFPFLKDLYNEYFRMLQTLYVKLAALYYESMPSFRFLVHLELILFSFKFISTANTFKSQKIACWTKKNTFSLGMAFLGSKEHVAQR
jgi:hypothetical protein